MEALLGIEAAPIVIIIIMQLTFFILGCFMDPSGIILLCTPIYVPVVTALGFSRVWFGVLFCVNMEMAFLTPPYGFNLFYIKGIAPRGVTMADIYLAALPFIIIQAIGLVIVLFIPNVVTLLPDMIFGPELGFRL